MPRTRRIAGLSLLVAGVAVAQAPPRVPRSYALVIGIATYPHLPPEKQLKFAERDAESVYSILISPQGGNFRAENVRRLSGANATLEALQRQLETWLPSTAGEDDRVLIYFAGHGFVHEGKAYFAPYDFDPSRPETTGYAMDALGNAIGKIRARSKILRISPFGLIEMTRQRIRPSLRRSVYEDCPCCRGTALVKTAESVAIEVVRLLLSSIHRDNVGKITVEVHDRVGAYLNNRKRKDLISFEEANNVTIHINARADVSPEHLQIRCFDGSGGELKFAIPEPSKSAR
jgi:hypothetical protein